MEDYQIIELMAQGYSPFLYFCQWIRNRVKGPSKVNRPTCGNQAVPRFRLVGKCPSCNISFCNLRNSDLFLF